MPDRSPLTSSSPESPMVTAGEYAAAAVVARSYERAWTTRGGAPDTPAWRDAARRAGRSDAERVLAALVEAGWSVAPPQHAPAAGFDWLGATDMEAMAEVDRITSVTAASRPVPTPSEGGT